MNIKRLLLIQSVVFLCTLTSCQEGKKVLSSKTETVDSVFQIPIAPSHITSKSDKINYVFEHYWDKFDFSDSSKVLNPNYGEQAIVDYIGYFPLVPLDKVEQSVKTLFDRVSKDPDIFLYFKNVFDNYLSNPNSPIHSDLFYEPVVQYMISSGQVDQNEKIKYQTLLPIIKKNKPGTLAADFDFLSSNGKTMNLHSIQAPFMLLMFYEPGCKNCEETISILKNNTGFNAVIEKGGLAVLAIYPDGNQQIWKDYFPNIPNNWINGVDPDQRIILKGIYQIKATPTIYLLDKEKKVILKDTDIHEIGQFFQNL